MESTTDRGSDTAYWVLRITFGVIPIVAGLDKFTNLLTDWQAYLSPLARSLLPVSPATFMGIAGGVEVVVGIAILSGHARTFGYVAVAWLAAIALNLVIAGLYDVAARDAAIAASAFALARLAPAHERASVTRREVTPREAQAHA